MNDPQPDFNDRSEYFPPRMKDDQPAGPSSSDRHHNHIKHHPQRAEPVQQVQPFPHLNENRNPERFTPQRKEVFKPDIPPAPQPAPREQQKFQQQQQEQIYDPFSQ